MIYVDTTKTAAAGHRSGLTRVTSRLLAELGPDASPVAWPFAENGARRREDWLLTAELFCEAERPGITAFLTGRGCRVAAIFHDAIPLRHPHITWPQSVARHPEYMKLLARFDRVWAVSAASRDELLGLWRWQGLERTPAVDVLPLGADFNGGPRVTELRPADTSPAQLLCLGIIEPRKNQGFLLDVCTALWAAGLDFELHIAGRVNPHFGGPILRQIQVAARRQRRLHVHHAPNDGRVADLLATARATVLPTVAEGCGLPLLESLWRGVPCICSDLPALRENADGGGCVAVTPNDHAAWREALQRIITDREAHAALSRQAASRQLNSWRDTANAILRAFRGDS